VEGDLVLQVSTSSGLVQVGQPVHSSLTLTNPSAGPVQNVRVDLIPSSGLILTAPGAQSVGDTLRFEFGTLAPGATVTLSWTGTVAGTNTLSATTKIEATAPGIEPTVAEVQHHFAAVLGTTIRNTEPPKVYRRVSVVRPVQVQVPLGAPLPAGAVLPVTGSSPMGGFIVLGLLLLAGGVYLVTRRRSHPGPARAALVLALLMLAACTPVERPGEQAAPTSGAEVSAEPTPDEVPPDEVKGTVIRPEDVPGEGSDEATTGTDSDVDQPTGTVIPETPEAPTMTTITVMERTTRRVLVPVDELEVRSLDSTPGDNHITGEWTGQDFDTLLSSRMITRGAQVGIGTSITSADGVVVIGVTIANLSEDHRLRVRGMVNHLVEGPLSAQLSEDVDVVLNPGGSIMVRFTYSLPAGSYSISSSFAATR
jgi:LPXTG-motif cell wall-anchored protein